MATTLTVQNSVTYCSTLIKNQRMNINNYEPGLTAARDILQLMLAPPFVWRFNRGSFSIPLLPPANSVKEALATEQYSTSSGNQFITLTFGGTTVVPVGATAVLAGMTTVTALNGGTYPVTAAAAGQVTLAVGTGSISQGAPVAETGTLAWTYAGASDYDVVLNDLGRIEQQWLDDGLGTPDSIISLNGAVSLQKFSVVRQPKQVSPQFDDNAGDITFRFDAVPDKAYTAHFDYQRKAPLISGWSQGFGPVPDEFAFIFNKWMLSEAALIVNDARFEIWRREAIAGLLATQDGLNEQAKNMFYDQMMNVGRTNFRGQSLGQSGAKARES